MLSRWPERRIRYIQAGLVVGWLLVIGSVLWPATYRFTDPTDAWALDGWTAKSSISGAVAQPYPVGLRIWWNIGIPAFIVTVLVLGHDAWRRICPLSFFSQIPRRLGFSRTRKDPSGARVPVLVRADSWWATNALQIQFWLLWLGLSARLVITNSNPVALVIFIGLTITAAFAVGWLFGGKTWCHYVCPMAPVQYVYAGPRGLLTTPAAQAGGQPSQSMCRQSSSTGDVSTCVACNSPCPDIDLERHYWERNEQPARRAVVYGYLGLVLGFLLQQAWQSPDHNTSSFWYEQTDWSTIYAPGWIIAGYAVPIPRWIAAPLLMAVMALLCMGAGFLCESLLLRRSAVAAETIRHRLMILAAVIALSVLLWTRVIPGLAVLPVMVRAIAGGAVLGALAIWAYRGWLRSRTAWHRDSLAASLRRRLAQLPISLATHLGGRRLEDLNTDEIHLLAQVATGMDQEHRKRLYREVLDDAVANGQHRAPATVSLLEGLRRQLGISEEEHQSALAHLTDLDVGDPRLRSFRQELERLVMRHLAAGRSLADSLSTEHDALLEAQERYGLTSDEVHRVTSELAAGDGILGHAAEQLAAQVADVHGLAASCAHQTNPFARFVHRQLCERGREVSAQFIAVLEALGDQDAAVSAARKAHGAQAWAPGGWKDRLAPNVSAALAQSATSSAQVKNITDVQARLINDPDPVIALMTARWSGTMPDTVDVRLRDDTQLPDFLRTAIEAIGAWRVTILRNDGNEKILDTVPAYIGRDRNNDVHIAHPLVSRRHAQIGRTGNDLWLRDLGGSNGTLVNGRWVRDISAALHDQSTIQLGGEQGPRLTVRQQRVATSDAAELLALLSISTLCSELPSSALYAVASACQSEVYTAGTTVLNAGQDVATLRVVLQGTASVRDRTGRTVGRISPGETIGELALVVGGPASATVHADTTLSCACLPAERFHMLLRSQPGMAQTLLAQVGRRLAQTLQGSVATADDAVTILPH